MTLPFRAPIGVAVCCASLGVFALATPGRAQDAEPPAAAEDKGAAEEVPSFDPAEDSDSPVAKKEASASAEGSVGLSTQEASAEAEAEASSKPAAKADATAKSVPAKPSVADSTEAAVTFETLTPAAFPMYKTRGIPGGSLQFEMHGLQWPYLPAVGAGPSMRIGFSGSVWVDTSYQTVDAGAEGEFDLEQWYQQGRLVLRFSPTYGFASGWFIQGQGEPVLNSDQSQTQPNVVDADDVWLKAGKWKLADLQVGRFQGWEIYHLGMGLDLNTTERRGASTENSFPVGLYGLTYAWDRPSGGGNAAVHLYPTEFLRFELLGQLGNGSGLNSLTARPTAIFDLGFLKLKGGAEYQKLTSRQDGIPEEFTRQGWGASAQLVFEPWVELGGGLAQGEVDHIDRNGGVDAGGSTSITTYGGFLNFQPIEDVVLGGGIHLTDQTNLQDNPRTGKGEELTHMQAFGAAQYLLLKKLTIKLVVAYGNAGFDYSGLAHYENKSLSERLRLMYLF